jgi:hypothetical protein
MTAMIIKNLFITHHQQPDTDFLNLISKNE